MKTASKILSIILMSLAVIALFSGAAAAAADAGYIKITDIQPEIEQGSSLTFSGDIIADGNGPYEFLAIIIGDDYWYYTYWTLDNKKQTSFVSIDDNISDIPIGQYYLLAINPVDSSYDVYADGDYLYYKNSPVGKLDDFTGISGAQKIIQYLQKPNVNDVYSGATFYVTENTTPSKTGNTETSNSIVIIVIVIIALAVIIGVVVIIILSRKEKAKQTTPVDSVANNIPPRESVVSDAPETEGIASSTRQQNNPNEHGYNFCPFCGAKLEEDANFCMVCGKEIPK